MVPAVMPESAPNQANTAAAGDTPEGTVRAAGGWGTALGRGEGTEAGPRSKTCIKIIPD